MKFLKTLWSFIVKVVQELLAPITDFENHLDGYKIGGFLAFGLVGYLAIAAVDLAYKNNIGGMTGLATFASLIAGIGYWMFGHAKQVDSAMANKSVVIPTISTTGGVSSPLVQPQGGANQ